MPQFAVLIPLVWLCGIQAVGFLRGSCLDPECRLLLFGVRISVGGDRADKSSIATTYTQDGALKRVTDPISDVTVTATHYLDGSVRTVDDGSNQNPYAYDAAGAVTVRTDKTAAAGPTGGDLVGTTYAYNQAGLPSRMSGGVLGERTAYEYDAKGRLLLEETGNHRQELAWPGMADLRLGFSEKKGSEAALDRSLKKAQKLHLKDCSDAASLGDG